MRLRVMSGRRKAIAELKATLTKSQSRCGTNHDAGASTEIAMISYRSLVEKGLTRTARAISSLGMANSCSGTS